MESRNEALEEGTTDGKYRKSRPDTKIARGLGAEISRPTGNLCRCRTGSSLVTTTGW